MLFWVSLHTARSLLTYYYGGHHISCRDLFVCKTVFFLQVSFHIDPLHLTCLSCSNTHACRHSESRNSHRFQERLACAPAVARSGSRIAEPEILYSDVLNPEILTGVKDSCVRLQSRGHRTPPEIADCTKTCVFRIF